MSAIESPNFTDGDNLLRKSKDDRLVISKPVIQKNLELFPLYFHENSLMKEPRTLFKLAALKKTCLLFENSDYRVGIKRGSPKRVEGHQCVEVELVFMNKLRNNINISVTL